MRLWDWAVAAYGRKGVAPACLALQDEHGQNVPLLLWAAWAGNVEAQAPGRAAALAREWEGAVGAPLRGVRRALKAPLPPVADAARAVLREEVKAVELAAERVLLHTLERLGPRAAPGDVGQALAAASAAWAGPPVPREALERLAAALR